MVRKRLLLLLKPFDVYPSYESSLHTTTTSSSSNRHKVLRYLYNRTLAHKNAIDFCQNILKKKSIEWKAVFRSDLSKPIHDVDMVITVGGDGTLLQASHLMDDSFPVLGVNSDPTQPKEVAEFSEEFDATRSTGYLCAATSSNFEQVFELARNGLYPCQLLHILSMNGSAAVMNSWYQVLDDVLENRSEPSELSRMAITVNSKLIPTYALNDILLAHPCPATVSRFSFRIKKDGEPSPLLHFRSSGLRVSTAAGSTAAMHSAGGFTMPILSKELQYLVREPISPGSSSHLMHGFVKSYETMDISWFCREGLLFIDGSHVCHSIQLGDTIELSSRAPLLKVYLSPDLLSRSE